MTTFFVFVIVYSILLVKPLSASTNYNLLDFGAKGDGITNSAQAFLDAWAAACSSTNSTIIYVPRGEYLIASSVQFKGDECKSPRVTIRIDGILVAPDDYLVLGEKINWFGFERVSGVSIVGGVFDAKGSALWACKGTGKPCPDGATTLSFLNSKNISISGLTSTNSQMFHIVINRCQNVRVKGLKIIAHEDSPNTDGIHVQLSTNVQIMTTSIKTGDDCISIGPGARNLWIERVSCGPGHGISIGSLAKDMEEEGVQNVTVLKTKFVGTQNGLRIKSWARPSNGYVQGVQFIDSVMYNVRNPIVIDQHYCPGNINCPNQASGVKINNVTYQDIRGTSATEVAINLDCSSQFPCKGVRFQNINLKYSNQAAQTKCTNVMVKVPGLVEPNGCL